MRFHLKDSNIVSIEGNPHMLRMGIIQCGFREFWVMLCIRGPKKDKVYIEELVHNTVSFTDDIYGNFKFIHDDNLANDLARFADENGLTDIGKRFGELVETGRSYLSLSEGKKIQI